MTAEQRAEWKAEVRSRVNVATGFAQLLRVNPDPRCGVEPDVLLVALN
jgi:hypothetical protein